MPPNDLATERLTGVEELAINGPDLDDTEYDQWRDNNLE